MRLVTDTGVRMEATALREMSVQGLMGWLLEAGRVLRHGGKTAQRKQMRVVETLALGAKKQLVLVSCGGEQFLVGTGADSVGTIVRLGAEGGSEAVGRVALEDVR